MILESQDIFESLTVNIPSSPDSRCFGRIMNRNNNNRHCWEIIMIFTSESNFNLRGDVVALSSLAVQLCW